jgi:hypothetical protein
MTEITVTPIIRDAINHAIELPACHESLLQSIQKHSEAESIPLDVLVNVSKLLVAEQKHHNLLAMDEDRKDTSNLSSVEPSQYYVHELMKGSSIYRTPLKRPSRVRWPFYFILFSMCATFILYEAFFFLLSDSCIL